MNIHNNVFMYSKIELYQDGWRLNVTPEEKTPSTIEVPIQEVLEEMAKIKNCSVSQLRIKK